MQLNKKEYTSSLIKLYLYIVCDTLILRQQTGVQLKNEKVAIKSESFIYTVIIV